MNKLQLEPGPARRESQESPSEGTEPSSGSCVDGLGNRDVAGLGVWVFRRVLWVIDCSGNSKSPVTY